MFFRTSPGLHCLAFRKLDEQTMKSAGSSAVIFFEASVLLASYAHDQRLVNIEPKASLPSCKVDKLTNLCNQILLPIRLLQKQCYPCLLCTAESALQRVLQYREEAEWILIGGPALDSMSDETFTRFISS